jgi:hypothetical protein
MGERIRAGNASAEDYFEMGSILLRKKVFTQAVRNLQAAAENWDGDEQGFGVGAQRARVWVLEHG